jgi:hypothetical protein
MATISNEKKVTARQVNLDAIRSDYENFKGTRVSFEAEIFGSRTAVAVSQSNFLIKLTDSSHTAHLADMNIEKRDVTREEWAIASALQPHNKIRILDGTVSFGLLRDGIPKITVKKFELIG